MGKKTKKGKQRKDTYYHKAKIAGFRARSAYKLVQLNTKYEFLQKSRVCIDLCAAPGSWMQVAKKHMPVSSIIVGVDLFPINPIPGTLSIVGDITTEKVRQELKSTLKTWKADLVLHDGAPNVGQNWLHDAYQQNLLVLHSFKLACEFLQKGGWFVTKVFRSKDYFNLEYIFRKLFKRVEATKPQASRYESAEIFVVCQNYLKPDKVDPEFFSPKHVFQELDPEPNTKINILKPEKTKQKAEGYAEGATTLYNKVPVSRFINSTNFIDVLQEASELYFDDDSIKNHRLTTETIVENCKDIKVLGRKDLRQLLTWRKNLKAEMKKLEETTAAAEAKGEAETEKTEEEEEEEELDKLQKQILEMKTEKAQEEKRARKRKLKEKKKLEEKLRLKSVIPGDTGPVETGGDGLFSLEKLSQVQNVDSVVDQEADILLSESEEEEEEEGPKYVKFDRNSSRLDRTGRYYMDGGKKEIGEDEVEEETDSEEEGLGLKDGAVTMSDVESEDDEEADNVNPLLTDLVGDSKEQRRARKAENWFSQDVFKGLETEADEDYELEAAMQKHMSKGGKLRTKEQPKKPKKKKEEAEVTNGNESGYTSDQSEEAEVARDAPDSTDSEGTDSDDTDSEDEKTPVGPQMPRAAVSAVGDGIKTKKRKRNEPATELDPVGLALATKMIHSKKAKRDIMDAGWNRYMNGDEDDLPDWFRKDEKRFNSMQVTVEREDLRMYRDRGKDVNARTIKKVVEAKARKQRRVKRRMGKARKKAENVVNNAEMSEKEKAQEVKKLYKKAMNPMKKKEATYVVMKKRHGGKKPKGTKGPYKLVDKRLKKDKEGMKKAEKKKPRPGNGRRKMNRANKRSNK
ncbi:pre-rRNA 2'-O-ribose RNA methyltransferase FTSJ3-like [Eriocheir sinensis]|uniref:pre-rRNA 2'-O-ribose RNA methyltransferase FTSJ3-like n=1 Tax=Eriocheir sinensis TaxID=95602 RepID=UPI0021C68C06|nr:pre-rRNA 2'-O-ribose RNA methyltransferase FTSJ3-like [Eriocheir sinensis]